MCSLEASEARSDCRSFGPLTQAKEVTQWLRLIEPITNATYTARSLPASCRARARRGTLDQALVRNAGAQSSPQRRKWAALLGLQRRPVVDGSASEGMERSTVLDVQASTGTRRQCPQRQSLRHHATRIRGLRARSEWWS